MDGWEEDLDVKHGFSAVQVTATNNAGTSNQSIPLNFTTYG